MSPRLRTGANTPDRVPTTTEAAPDRIRPDIIVLDLQLPDMSGFEVLKSLRLAKVQTPVLILSGNAIVEAKVKAPCAMPKVATATGTPRMSAMAESGMSTAR